MGIYAEIAWRKLNEFLKPVWRWRPSQRTAILGGSVLMIAMIIVGATLLDDVMLSINTRDRLYQETETGEQKAPDLPESLIWIGDKASYSNDLTALFFWNPSCVTCDKTYSNIDTWKSRYSQYGLKVIPVLNARYEFEADPDFIADTIKKHGIQAPIAYDVDYELEDAMNEASQTFQLAQDSAIVLVDGNKKIRHIDIDGASPYNTELVIQGLLSESGSNAEFPRPVGKRNQVTSITGALYFGDLEETKQTFASNPEFSLEETTYGSEDGVQLSDGEWGLSGTWKGNDRSIQSVSSGYLSTIVSGTKVYIIAESKKDDFIGITVNDEVKARAEDVDKDGLIKINKPGVYQIVDSDKPLKNARITLSVPDEAIIYQLMVLSD